MKTAIITTTIHVPKLLADYAKDAQAHKRAIEFYVVGDRKTPPEAESFCKNLASETGIPMHWLGVREQEEILASYPELGAHLPWNCIQRRNVGHLLAVADGHEMIIAIDDDNFRTDDDYVGLHLAALNAKETESVSAKSGWFNCCALLEEAQGRQFFPRGYPVLQRTGLPGEMSYAKSNARVVVNAGLWLGDPDIDAVTRLAIQPDATAVKRKETLALAKGTWCPFNSQNTAVHRDVMPAWFMSPCVGRFDDIWGSYIALTCIEHMGHAIAFGRPLVRQDRNAHDLYRDFDLERLGMRYTDGFCAALRATPLKGKDYATCALEALDITANWAANDPKLDKDSRAAIEKFVEGYRHWTNAFKRAGSEAPAKTRAVV
jgi:hypothetical protein